MATFSIYKLSKIWYVRLCGIIGFKCIILLKCVHVDSPNFAMLKKRYLGLSSVATKQQAPSLDVAFLIRLVQKRWTEMCWRRQTYAFAELTLCKKSTVRLGSVDLWTSYIQDCHLLITRQFVNTTTGASIRSLALFSIDGCTSNRSLPFSKREFDQATRKRSEV